MTPIPCVANAQWIAGKRAGDKTILRPDIRTGRQGLIAGPNDLRTRLTGKQPALLLAARQISAGRQGYDRAACRCGARVCILQISCAGSVIAVSLRTL
jgi:hypothetical protein